MDSSAIISRPLKTREGHEITDNLLEVITLKISRGYHPKLFSLDNEITNKLKTLLCLASIDFQLVPPHCHRNAAKQSIQTWKAHFISFLCTVDPLFLMHLWCRLLTQVDLTLNHMRASNLHPQVSAFHALFDKFDFDRTPLILPGTRAMIYEHERLIFGTKSLEGWYFRPTVDHYCCHDIYARKKKHKNW